MDSRVQTRHDMSHKLSNAHEFIGMLTVMDFCVGMVLIVQSLLAVNENRLGRIRLFEMRYSCLVINLRWHEGSWRDPLMRANTFIDLKISPFDREMLVKFLEYQSNISLSIFHLGQNARVTKFISHYVSVWKNHLHVFGTFYNNTSWERECTMRSEFFDNVTNTKVPFSWKSIKRYQSSFARNVSRSRHLNE